VERSLEAEALALERPRETQLRHIARGADLAAAAARARGFWKSGREGRGGESGGGERRGDGGGRLAGEDRFVSFRFVYSLKVGLWKGPLCPSNFWRFYGNTIIFGGILPFLILSFSSTEYFYFSFWNSV